MYVQQHVFRTVDQVSCMLGIFTSKVVLCTLFDGWNIFFGVFSGVFTFFPLLWWYLIPLQTTHSIFYLHDVMILIFRSTNWNYMWEHLWKKYGLVGRGLAKWWQWLLIPNHSYCWCSIDIYSLRFPLDSGVMWWLRTWESKELSLRPWDLDLSYPSLLWVSFLFSLYPNQTLLMSPFSPVFHMVETVRFDLTLRVNSPTLENKMSRLVNKALKISFSFTP